MRIFQTTGRNRKRTEALLAQLERRSGSSLETVLPTVRKILAKVRKEGDRALIAYAIKFDKLGQVPNRITEEETAGAWQQLDPTLQQALKTAAGNIRAFAQRQLPKSWQSSPMQGLTTGQLVRPIESVGCYVPGGRHPLPSTMLMTVIPAQVAGVPRIVVTSPNPARETLATAHMLGVKEFYRIGGSHAVAALAYGTESIQRVAKIVGPGNLYVTAAKREIAFECGIDMLAGPTEIVVTSEEGTAADIASDLVAQAEHDPESLAIFITTNKSLAKAVQAETKARASKNPIAKQAIASNGYIFLASTTEHAHEITNRLAPEHLTVDSEADLAWVQNAGSIFIGQSSPQPMGDYISGPNHTLPTGGMANIRGGLSVNDFVKLITVQQYSPKALAKLGPQAIRLAQAEGLTAHAEAIKTRLGIEPGAPCLDPETWVSTNLKSTQGER
jgi:histidinol dehydrogenase